MYPYLRTLVQALHASQIEPQSKGPDPKIQAAVKPFHDGLMVLLTRALSVCTYMCPTYTHIGRNGERARGRERERETEGEREGGRERDLVRAF